MLGDQLVLEEELDHLAAAADLHPAAAEPVRHRVAAAFEVHQAVAVHGADDADVEHLRQPLGLR